MFSLRPNLRVHTIFVKMSVFIYQRKTFQGHILWEKSGNKKVSLIFSLKAERTIRQCKKQSKPKCACLCNSHDFKENFVIFKGSNS